LRVGNVERTSPVLPESTTVEFTVHLTAGRTCLEAWFSQEGSNKPWPAAAVAIERIGPADDRETAAYRASDPNKLLR